jgi:hypothetical protein
VLDCGLRPTLPRTNRALLLSVKLITSLAWSETVLPVVGDEPASSDQQCFDIFDRGIAHSLPD